MFKIDKNRTFDSDIPIITDNYEVLHFDEYPILFIGTNNYGNKIIGSLLFEDDETDTFRYLQIQVTDKFFRDFLGKKTSYKDIISQSKAIFIVDKDINNKVLSTYHLSFSEIPNDYLPLPSAFCPDANFKFGFEFGISLKGNLADVHEAMIKAAYSVTNSVAGLIRNALDSLYDLKLQPEINQLPYTEGSFKINLKVKIPNYKNIFISQNDIGDYVNKYLSYCIEDLPNEVEQLTDKISENDGKFESLSQFVENMYSKSAITYNTKSKERLKSDVIDSVVTLEKLADEVGNGFNEIEIFGKVQNNKVQIPIAHIDKVQSKKISEISDFLNTGLEGTTQDDVDTEYSICIYHLNTDTRIGNAYIYTDEEKTTMDKPKIEILGDEELSGTIYTESLHLNKWIKVRGMAQKYKDKFKRISIKGNFKN
jgi:hypothetical protein